MIEKRNSSPSLKKQKSSIQKKICHRVPRKKTSDSKFLLGVKRFLIQRKHTVRKHKSKPISGIGPVTRTRNSSLSASSNDIHKRKSLPKSPPVLPIQASSGSFGQQESPESPPLLSIEDQNSETWEDNECDLSGDISSDQSSQAWEEDELDLPDESTDCPTSSPPVPHMNDEKKIVRISNASSPATFVTSPFGHFQTSARVGFDRNLEPLKIVKMGEFRGKYYFMMKWKGSEIMDMVPTDIAKEKCPQVVIEFYESHLQNVHNRAADCKESTT